MLTCISFLIYFGGEVGYGKSRDKDYKGYEETTGGFRYVHYFDYGNGLLYVYIYQNLSNCTF